MSEEVKRRGSVFIISSPSGAGKSTLTNLLIKKDPKIFKSVSLTTREKRLSEVNGNHYFFVTQEDFFSLRDSNKLLEHAFVHGNFYGMPKEPVEKALFVNQDVLFDVDFQGAHTIYNYYKDKYNVVSIFVLPPSILELKSRLLKRAENNFNDIKNRLHGSKNEIMQWDSYDYILINQDLEKTFENLWSIVCAERLGKKQCINIQSYIEDLLRELAHEV